MLYMINIPLSIATVVYSSYVYMSLDQNMLGIWHLMFYPSITIILQTCVCFSSLTLTFPCVLYDISEYQRPFSVTVTIYILVAILVLMVAKILFLSILYVDALQDSTMIVIYQIISFLIISSTVAGFFIDSLQYCSGWAYSDYLKHHNHPEVGYAFFPFTLPAKEMEDYLGEHYITRRAHTV